MLSLKHNILRKKGRVLNEYSHQNLTAFVIIHHNFNVDLRLSRGTNKNTSARISASPLKLPVSDTFRETSGLFQKKYVAFFIHVKTVLRFRKSRTFKHSEIAYPLHLIAQQKSTLYYASFFKTGFETLCNPAPSSKIPDGRCNRPLSIYQNSVCQRGLEDTNKEN